MFCVECKIRIIDGECKPEDCHKIYFFFKPNIFKFVYSLILFDMQLVNITKNKDLQLIKNKS